jgi:tetratricopeptide (TPR) repeat protein
MLLPPLLPPLLLLLLLLLGDGHAQPGGVAVRSRARADGGRSRFDVRQPPYGFVVGGSSIEELNGVYGPRLPRHHPEDGRIIPAPPRFAQFVHLGAYAHDSSGWWLVNLRRPVREAEQQRDGGGGGGAGGGAGDGGPPPTEVEWVFFDPAGVERFRHPGEGLIPGYGPAWSHVAQPASASASSDEAKARSNTGDGLPAADPLDEAAAAYEALQEVAPQNIDGSELPLLIAPIPADQNGGITSHFYEQLLPQLRRQRAAEAMAAALQRHGASPWNNTEEAVRREAKDNGVVGFVTAPPEESCPKWLFPEEGGVSYADLAHRLYAKQSFREAAGCFDAAVAHMILSAVEKEEEEEQEERRRHGGQGAPGAILLLDTVPLRLLHASALRRAGNATAALSVVEAVAVALQVHCFPNNVAGAWKRKKLMSVRAYLAIGEILLDAGRPDGAVSALEQAFALLKRPKEYDELLCMEVDGGAEEDAEAEQQEQAEGSNGEDVEYGEDEDDLDLDDDIDDIDDIDDAADDWDPDESAEGKRLERLLLMAVAASRRTSPPPHLVSPPVPAPPGCMLVPVGPHIAIWPMSGKEVQVDGLEDKVCPAVINRTNWIGDEGYNYNSMRMRFKVEKSGIQLKLSRLPEEEVDITHGWGVPLQFFCCKNTTTAGRRNAPEMLDDAAVTKDVTSDDGKPAVALQENKDHYLVLGLTRDFSEEQLKKAFRMLSRVLHPDRPGGSVAKFARISTAHECLSDSQCREDFDAGKDLGRAGCDSAEYSLEEEVEYRYWPARRPFQPYGDPSEFCRGPDCP